MKMKRLKIIRIKGKKSCSAGLKQKSPAIKYRRGLKLLSDPAGARTQDPILKRDVLYLLSY